jgi:NAD(P)-dependent dehydrogenase (short-subunit alcohol dehydrogenase family)
MYVKDYTLTGEGIEAHLSSNHVGHFLLTNLLLPKILAAGKGARIVNLTSSAHVVSPMRFDDYHFENGKTYDPWLAYGQSKTANILFTTALAAKLASKGILAFAVHPGIITTNLASHIEYSEFPKLVKMYEDNGVYHKSLHRTRMLTTTGAPTPGFDRDVAQGTSGTIFAALSPSLESKSFLWSPLTKIVVLTLISEHSGAYLSDCAVEKTPEYAHDLKLAEALWRLSEGLVKETFAI